MKDNLRCEIVEDLLPLYTDNLTSYFTSEAVKNHLSSCERCSKVYEIMIEPVENEKIEKKEIDWFRKIRRIKYTLALIAVFLMSTFVILYDFFTSFTSVRIDVMWTYLYYTKVEKWLIPYYAISILSLFLLIIIWYKNNRHRIVKKAKQAACIILLIILVLNFAYQTTSYFHYEGLKKELKIIAEGKSDIRPSMTFVQCLKEEYISSSEYWEHDISTPLILHAFGKGKVYLVYSITSEHTGTSNAPVIISYKLMKGKVVITDIDESGHGV